MGETDGSLVNGSIASDLLFCLIGFCCAVLVILCCAGYLGCCVFLGWISLWKVVR